MIRSICLQNWLRQLVREPTRGECLLGLAITDIESANACVASNIADHAIVIARLNMTLPQTAAHKRKVWSYVKADWGGLKEELQETGWSLIASCNASRAAVLMAELILEKSSKHIPQRIRHAKKSSHPWLMDDVVRLVAVKIAALGTPFYEEAVNNCSVAIAPSAPVPRF